MVVIFSGTRIEGLEGTYAVPALASQADIAHADVIYTDNKRIIAMAKKSGVTVRDFPKHPPTVKVEKTIPQPEMPVTTEPLMVLEPLEPIEEVIDASVLTASSSIEDDINNGMATKDLKVKYNKTGTEIGKLRRSLKAK